MLLAARVSELFAVAQPTAPPPQGFGGYRALGIVLYTEYVVPLELTGLILLAAILGAVVLAKRSLD